MTGTDVRGVTRAPGAQVWGPLVSLWILWGSTYLGIAVMGRALPPLLGNGLRFIAAGLVLALGLAAIRGPRVLAISRAELRSLAIMGVGVLGVGIGTVALAERYVPSGVVALLVAVMPLWIIVFRLRAGERPAVLTLVGVAIGLGGLSLMLLPGGTTPVAGDDHDVVVWSLAIMVSSFSWAFFSWRSTGYSLPSNPVVTTTYELAVAGALLLGVGALRGERLHAEQVTASSAGAWLFLVVASVAGYTAYTWLLGHAPMSLTSTYAYVNPVVAVFLGWLIIGEQITPDVLLGLTVVVGGVVLVVSGERRRRPN
jgi:drug/metabolite transporter (DMT)-like permease